jgi:threonylcarbamoyladenosine tRNA methylthiotransferase MtaB
MLLLPVGCYAQLKPEELAAVDGVDLVLGATENLKSLITLTICPRMIWVKYLEIADADFMLEVIPLVTGLSIFKSSRWLRL